MDQPPLVPTAAEIFQTAARSFGVRDWTQAGALCRQVLAANPRHADALHMLGLVFSETDRSEQAIATLREAIAEQPGSAAVWSNLGVVYRKAGRFADAVECLRNAIGLQESLPETHHNLSIANYRLGRFDDALAAARRATQLRPGYAEAHYHLGNLLREAGRLEAAVAAYQSALLITPDWPDAHLVIAAAWQELGEPARGLPHYRETLRLQPGCSAAEHSMGHALRTLGRIDEAKAAYARAAAITGMSTDRERMGVLFRETLAEVVAPDHASIDQYKARVDLAIRAYAAEPGTLDLSQLHTHGAVPSMSLAYYGGNVRPIMEQYAQAIGPQIPRFPLRPRQGKPKLGIVVTNTHERVFARCWGRIAERLPRELFDIRVVCSRGGANVLQTLLQIPADEYLILPVTIDDAARLLHDREFDWLHYWEIGTDTMNYYLPFFRPAAGQSACWGWPVTSGNPQINSYLSCEQLEPPVGPTHYSEQLVLLTQLPTYYIRPPVSSGPPPRSRFGLEDRQHVYLCTQNVRKYHPDFDPLLADLLRSDPLGRLVILADLQAEITELLLDRFRRTMPDVVARVLVMPQMEREEYLALIAVSDVVLDTLHYGAGANSVYDAVAAGTPLVTLPGEFHRTRWAAAVNRRLGLTRLIANSTQEYVATAVQVACDADLRQVLLQQIVTRGEELFEDVAVVSEHDAYFSQAIAGTRAG